MCKYRLGQYVNVDVGIVNFIYKYSWIVYNNTIVNLKESTNTT